MLLVVAEAIEFVTVSALEVAIEVVDVEIEEGIVLFVLGGMGVEKVEKGLVVVVLAAYFE